MIMFIRYTSKKMQYLRHRPHKMLEHKMKIKYHMIYFYIW